jgi:hypothetical protein
VTVSAIHLISTAFMAGLIVFVQVVHYPLMGTVGEDAFVSYERGHTVRTGWVVAPVMLVELASATWLLMFPPLSTLQPVAWTGALLLLVIWASTVLIQAPIHGRLTRAFDPSLHRRLVATNWIRTGAWMARLPVALLLVNATT